jgi:hypothetical protein
MKITWIVSLLLTAAFVTPASANWFHNPYQNINRNIGSAPNPTPADVREMRLPVVVEDGVPVRGFTVLEPAKDADKSATATPQSTPQAPAQTSNAGVVAAASPSR